MNSLSVVMIVKNESAWLAQCLDSIVGIADEIVIGDTGSTDNTVDIAARFRARTIQVPWTNDFASARNAVVDAATGDWLLHLDADEALDDSGAHRIREIVDGDGFGADAIEVMLANYCDDVRAWRWVPVNSNGTHARGHSGYIAVPLLRLFRNHCGYRYREPVHENITESVREQGGVMRAEHEIVVHHYGFAKPTPRKAELYLAIAREKVKTRPGDPKAWHDLAEQLVGLNQPEEAESAARRALDLDPDHVGAATTLANVLLNRGDLGSAEQVLSDIVSRGASAPHLMTALAAIALRNGDPEKADTYLRASADTPTVLGLLNHARVLDVLGRQNDAAEKLNSAMALAPAVQEVADRVRAHELRLNAVASLHAGDSKQSLAALVQALKLDAEDPLTHQAIAQALEALGQSDRATESLARAYALAPSLRKR